MGQDENSLALYSTISFFFKGICLTCRFLYENLRLFELHVDGHPKKRIQEEEEKQQDWDYMRNNHI